MILLLKISKLSKFKEWVNKIVLSATLNFYFFNLSTLNFKRMVVIGLERDFSLLIYGFSTAFSSPHVNYFFFFNFFGKWAKRHGFVFL